MRTAGRARIVATADLPRSDLATEIKSGNPFVASASLSWRFSWS
jgi:hypothetical protein